MENNFDTNSYLDMELLRFTTAGSVDDGKSTLDWTPPLRQQEHLRGPSPTDRTNLKKERPRARRPQPFH
jgi:hypothetical protein